MRISWGLEIQERQGNQRDRVMTLHNLGVIAQEQGDYAEARRLYEQNLEVFKQLGDQSGRATTLHNLGAIAQLQRRSGSMDNAWKSTSGWETSGDEWIRLGPWA